VALLYGKFLRKLQQVNGFEAVLQPKNEIRVMASAPKNFCRGKNRNRIGRGRCPDWVVAGYFIFPVYGRQAPPSFCYKKRLQHFLWEEGEKPRHQMAQ